MKEYNNLEDFKKFIEKESKIDSEIKVKNEKFILVKLNRENSDVKVEDVNQVEGVYMGFEFYDILKAVYQSKYRLIKIKLGRGIRNFTKVNYYYNESRKKLNKRIIELNQDLTNLLEQYDRMKKELSDTEEILNIFEKELDIKNIDKQEILDKSKEKKYHVETKEDIDKRQFRAFGKTFESSLPKLVVRSEDNLPTK